MTEYPISKVSAIINGKLSGNDKHIIRHLLIDSRSASVASDSLFFAIKGNRHNGHSYIEDLYKRGIRAFVISENIEFKSFPEAGFILVDDCLRALQYLAAYHRNKFSCKTIAITGSNGKTIVKEWLFHCLSNNFTITRSPKSYNSQVGVPLSLWLLDDSTNLGIFEAGISLPDEMANLQRIIKPDIGIFTNIGEAHQENFKNTEHKLREKLKLFSECSVLIYNKDQQRVDEIINTTPSLTSVKLFTWSLKDTGNIRIKSLKKYSSETKLTCLYENTSIEICIPFTDDASIENAIHCISVMIYINIDKETIITKISDLPPIAMRLEQKSAINYCTLINDSYNSDLNSLAIALDVLNRQIQHENKTLILSDILQSGKNQAELYKLVAEMVEDKGVTRIIGIGKTINENRQYFRITSKFYETTDDFIKDFKSDLFKDEAILLKGSRNFEFEKIAMLLERKKHSTRIEINLQSLVHNLNFFRSLLKRETKTMVMVKALSYGSGQHEIASILEFQRVDYLGVAIADEGVSLRKAGIKTPIIVMNPEAESFDIIIQYKLEPEIYSLDIMDQFSKAVAKNQEINYPVHIKLDTGMHRLGFLMNEIDKLCFSLNENKNILVKSVFSHLAGSDEEQFDAFTENQINLFKQASDKIIESLGYPVIRHILNTAGIERFSHAQFDMVRLGIGLYGVGFENQGNLKNVSTLKSTILQIKKVEPGETVGYSRKGNPKRLTTIAIIPIGYADGINRKLGNGTISFLVNGKPAPIIGNICMDMTMIDITGIKAKVGDEVIIFGEGNSIIDIARKIETIPYEILTGISERVKRVYFYE